MKAEIPATIPASIVSANAGLAAISFKMVSPAEVDLYNEVVNDEPMTNNIGIASMRTTDHLPKEVFGVTLKSCFIILFTFRSEKLLTHKIEFKVSVLG